jgi:hypothetical protein
VQPVTRVRASNTIDAVDGIKTRDTNGGANKQFKATDEHPEKRYGKVRGGDYTHRSSFFSYTASREGMLFTPSDPPGSATRHNPGTCRTPQIPP